MNVIDVTPETPRDFTKVQGKMHQLSGPSKGLPKKDPDTLCNGRKHKVKGYCTQQAGWGVPDKTTGRCKLHGGMTLRGADHPRATHLRYSKYAPDKIIEKYETMMKDPKILNMREEIALCRARLSELLEETKHERSDSLWDQLHEEMEKMRRARGRGDVAGLTAAVGNIERVIESGFKAREAWAEIGEHMDRLSRIVSLERRHIVAMKYLMTVEDVGVLFTQITQIIQVNMRDEGERRTTVRELRGLLSESNDRSTGPGSGSDGTSEDLETLQG